jgi:geranylgeranyl pyrophosphate synthase
MNEAIDMTSETLDRALGSVDATLQHVVLSDVDILQQASHHIISAGGKRLRPQVVFLAYSAAGGQDMFEAVSLASAVELVHTATLVHDDINDHSLTRRGKIAVHARWGRTFALLTGDYLFTKVYELMAPYGARQNTIMAAACVQLVEGETMQAAAAKAGKIDQDTYKAIISRKTASLFEAAARMGALLVTSDELIVKALGDYGRYLGMAFQIVDDVLDIVGDEETLGKPVGSDLLQGSGAIMAQNGRESASVAAPEDGETDPIKLMLSRLRDSGAVDVALAQAHLMAERARQALDLVPDSPARDEMTQIVDLVVNRER